MEPCTSSTFVVPSSWRPRAKLVGPQPWFSTSLMAARPSSRNSSVSEALSQAVPLLLLLLLLLLF
eukprot:7065684-Lingulodinium_polyedra.AAC.1